MPARRDSMGRWPAALPSSYGDECVRGRASVAAARRALGVVIAALCWTFAPSGHGVDEPRRTTTTSLALSASSFDVEIVGRLLALIPTHLSARDVQEVLAHVPAPRIINLQGSLAPVTMQPFAEFLIAMGYPEERLRDPVRGGFSYSSFVDSGELAGTLAWHYEREGMMPLLIGHSQGGMVAIRVLHELAGAFNAEIPVWDPVAGAATDRTTIRDPLTGATRPVVGLRVPYVAALATGKLPRILLGQWSMLSKLRKIPDSAIDFTGFSIEWDPIAGNFPGAEPYAATGSAAVRNVTLPVSYSHVDLPNAAHLATQPATRAWIDAYDPASPPAPMPEDPAVDVTNLLHAADIWFSVKKHWCLAAQALLPAR